MNHRRTTNKIVTIIDLIVDLIVIISSGCVFYTYLLCFICKNLILCH